MIKQSSVDTSNGQQGKAVVVLGMHRSGTSAWTRLLNLAGVYLGSNLLGANSGNQEGHWENEPIMRLDEAIFRSVGHSWDRVDRIHPESLLQPGIGPLQQAILEELKQQFAGKALWGIKDPRMCRLMPVWHQLLSAMNAVPAYVLVIRHPFEVAWSLQKRNAMPLNDGLLLWLLHVLESERESRSGPRVVVNYDQAFRDPLGALEKIAGLLALPLRTAAPGVSEQIHAFIRPDLKHNHPSDLRQQDPFLDRDAADLAEMVYEHCLAAVLSDKALDTTLMDLAYARLVTRFPVTVEENKSLLRQSMGRMKARTADYASLLADGNRNPGSGQGNYVASQILVYASRLIQETIRFNNLEDPLNQRGDYGSVTEARQLLEKAVRLSPDAAEPATEKISMDQKIADVNFHRWLRLNPLREVDAQVMAERMIKRWRQQPTVNVVLTGESSKEALEATLRGLENQLYKKWTLSVALEGAIDEAAFAGLANPLAFFAAKPETGQALYSSDMAMQAEWVLHLPVGWVLQPQAIVQLLDYANLRQEWHLLYCDHAHSDPARGMHSPCCKPDFNLELCRSMPALFGPVLLVRRLAMECMPQEEMISPYFPEQLLFRVFESFGESAIGHVAAMLVHADDSAAGGRQEDEAMRQRIVSRHLARSGEAFPVSKSFAENTLRIGYPLQGQPLVSVVIAVRDRLEFISECVASLLDRTEYPNFEIIIIDGGSSNPDLMLWYEGVQARGVRIMQYSGTPGYAGLYNCGAYEANGEYLVFLADDAQIIQGNWIERLLVHAQRERVGIAGPMLQRPENRGYLDAGMQLGLEGTAASPESLGTCPGSGEILLVDREQSTVQGSCFLVRRSVYDTVQGLDTSFASQHHAVLDFCLKTRQMGYRIIWTPYCQVVAHAVPASWFAGMPAQQVTSRMDEEKQLVWRRWLKVLAHDPAVSKFCSLEKGGELEADVPVPWDGNFHDRLRILGFPLPGASGDYRVILPLDVLSRQGLVQAGHVRMANLRTRMLSPVEMERLAPDVLVVHMAINDVQLEALKLYRQFNPSLFVVFVIDDLIDRVAEKSSAYRAIRSQFRDGMRRIRGALEYSDRLVVSTQPLADAYASCIDDIRVIPNYLQLARWQHISPLRSQGGKPRVGWVGAQQHQGDLELLIDVVRATCHEVDWVFMGMCIDEIRPYLKEEYEFVAINEYPEKMAMLGLDVAVAPLVDDDFNRAKSNLRLLEYGMMGWPVICSDVLPYRDAPVTRVANHTDAWSLAIRQLLSDLPAARAKGAALRDWVMQYHLLENHLDEWIDGLLPGKMIRKELH